MTQSHFCYNWKETRSHGFNASCSGVTSGFLIFDEGLTSFCDCYTDISWIWTLFLTVPPDKLLDVLTGGGGFSFFKVSCIVEGTSVRDGLFGIMLYDGGSSCFSFLLIMGDWRDELSGLEGRCDIGIVSVDGDELEREERTLFCLRRSRSLW